MIIHELMFTNPVLEVSVELREFKFWINRKTKQIFPDAVTAVISYISKFFERLYELYFSLLKNTLRFYHLKKA